MGKKPTLGEEVELTGPSLGEEVELSITPPPDPFLQAPPAGSGQGPTSTPSTGQGMSLGGPSAPSGGGGMLDDAGDGVMTVSPRDARIQRLQAAGIDTTERIQMDAPKPTPLGEYRGMDAQYETPKQLIDRTLGTPEVREQFKEYARIDSRYQSEFEPLDAAKVEERRKQNQIAKAAVPAMEGAFVANLDRLKAEGQALSEQKAVIEGMNPADPMYAQSLGEYNQRVAMLNREQRAIELEAAVISDASKKAALDEFLINKRDYEIKAKKGNMPAAMGYSALNVIGKELSGGLEALGKVVPTDQQILEFFGLAEEGAGEKSMQAWEKYLEDVETAPTRLTGIDRFVTPEYIERKKQDSMFAEGLLTIAEMSPALAAGVFAGTPGMAASFFTSSYRDVGSEMQGEYWDQIPEAEKEAIKIGTAFVSAGLSTMGMQALAGKIPIVNDIFFRAAKQFTGNMSAGQVRRIIDSETKNYVSNVLSRATQGVALEGIEETLDYTQEEAVKHFYEEYKRGQFGDQADTLFQNAETMTELMDGAKKSFLLGGLVGGMLGGSMAAVSSIGARQRLKDKEFDAFKKLLDSGALRSDIEPIMAAQVEAGEMSQSDFDKFSQDLDVAEKAMSLIPEGMGIKATREAFDLLLEKQRLSAKDKNLVKAKIMAIDEKLAAMVPAPEAEAKTEATKEAEPTPSPKPEAPKKGTPDTPAATMEWEGEAVEAESLKPDPAFLASTSRDNDIGRPVTYQGAEGILAKNEDGYFVVTPEEDIMIEGGLSEATNEELGLTARLTDPEVQLDLTEVEVDDVGVDPNAVLTDFGDGRIVYRGSEYGYVRTNLDNNGNEVSVTVTDADGNEKTIRNKQAVEEIVLQKLLYEDWINAQPKPNEIQSAAAELGLEERAPVPAKRDKGRPRKVQPKRSDKIAEAPAKQVAPVPEPASESLTEVEAKPQTPPEATPSVTPTPVASQEKAAEATVVKTGEELQPTSPAAPQQPKTEAPKKKAFEGEVAQEAKDEIAKIVKAAYGNLMNLSGPANAKYRQRILELLTGTKPPKAKAGINAVEEALFDASNAEGLSTASKRDAVYEWLGLKDGSKKEEGPKNLEVVDDGDMPIYAVRINTPDGQQLRYAVAVSGKPASGDPLHKTVDAAKADRLVVEEDKRDREKIAAAEAEKQTAKEAEDAAEKERLSTGFFAGKSPMQAGKLDASLSKSIKLNGKFYKTRREGIEALVSDGYKIGSNKTFGRILESPSGSFLSESDITKTGMDYAEYLLSTPKDKKPPVSDQPPVAQAEEKPKEETPKKPISDKAKAIADKLREGKFGGKSIKSSIPGFEQAWDGAIEAAATVIEAGGNAAQAISDAIKAFKNSDWYKNASKEERQKQEVAVSDYVSGIASEIEEPKKVEPKKEKGEPKKVKKTFTTVRAYEGEFREEVKKELEKSGLYRNIENQEEAEASADAFIAKVGIDAALSAVREGDIRGGAATVIRVRALEELQSQYMEATTQEELEAISIMMADIIQENSLAYTLGGQESAMLNRMYKTSDLGFFSEQKAKEWREEFGEDPSPEMMSEWKERDKELNDLRKQLEEATKRAEEAEANAAVEAIKKSVDKEKRKPRTYTRKAKDLADQFRKLKAAPMTFRDANGNIIEVKEMGGGWNELVEIGAKVIEKTGQLIDGINAIADYLKGQPWFSALDEKSKEAVMQQIEEKFRAMNEEDVDAGRIRIPKAMIREAVEAGANDINTLVAVIKEQIKGDYPDATDREIRDAITEYGKVVNMSQDEISAKIRRMKDIGRTISAIEDVEAKKRPLRSGLQRDKLDAEQRALKKKLRELMKELPVDEETQQRELKTALDAAKTRMRNRIEDMQREIEMRERIRKSNKVVEADQELLDLKAQKEELQKQHDEIFKNEEVSIEERIKRAEDSVRRSIEDLAQRIKEGRIELEKKGQLQSPELTKLRAQRDALRELLQQMRDRSGLTEKKRLEAAKESVRRRMADLQRQIDSGKKDVKEQKPIAEDTELSLLKSEKQRLQQEFDEIFKDKTITEEERLEAAINAARRSLDDIRKKIDAKEVDPKKSTPVKPNEELLKLREQLQEARAEYTRLQDEAGVILKKRLATAKAMAKNRMADLQKRLDEKDFEPRKRKDPVQDTELVALKAKQMRLREKYDKEFYKYRLANRTPAERAKDAVAQAWGLTRALQATGEFSFMLIQGGKLTISNLWHKPEAVASAMKNAMRAFASESKSDIWLMKVKAQDWYPAAKEAKLAITEPHAEMSAREELFFSDWTRAIWSIVGSPLLLKSAKAHARWEAANPFRAIERSAVAYLDTLRIERYLDGLSMLEKNGIAPTKEERKDIADVANTLTGRASLGPMEGKVAKALTAIFFSPRLWSSAIKTATPYALWHFGKMSPTARKMAMQDMGRFVGTTMGFVAMAAVYLNADDDDETGVELDPRSSDFLKIKIGDTRIDPWGGMIQQVVFTTKLTIGMAALMADKPYLAHKSPKTGELSPLGVKFKSPTMFDVLTQMATNKLAPSASLLAEGMRSELRKGPDGQPMRVNVFGEEFKMSDKALEKLTPIYWETIGELMEENPGALEGFLLLYAFLGGGVQVQKPRDKAPSATRRTMSAPGGPGGPSDGPGGPP